MFNEYEKLRMRQNPMLQNRMQVGGRSMPAWFSASLVTQSRIGAPSPPPPPIPVAPPPPDESDYEEIDHIPKSAMKKLNSRRACSLCGNPNPAVSCEMCSNQIFCGSCNDMYHRHPKRQHHSRKILDPLDNRPPIPPKTPIPPEMMQMQAQLPPLPPQHPGQYPSQAVSTPQPPPRRKGRFGMRSAAGSPTTGIKSIFDPVGTLKRFMGGMSHRPLPPTPKPPPPLPPKPSDLGRSITPTPRFQTLGDRRLSSPQPGNFTQNFNDPRGRMPMHVSEMQNARHHSISVANLSGHTTSRDSGYPDWEEDEEDIFSRNRAHSISHTALGRFPSTSQDAPHFATLHRPGRNLRQQMQSQPQLQQTSQDAPERPPPPLPPRQFPSQTQLAFSSSQSSFDLDRMAAVAQQQQFGGMPPWNGYPMPGYPFEMQQAMMMGYPTGTMHRTPSTQSMGPTMNPSAAPNQQGFFGWGPMGYGPPMTQMEMEMMAAHHRRGSDMNLLPHQQTQRNVPLSNPVTPQGSFRKKQGRQMSMEPEFTRRLERGLDLTQNRRSGTPSSFVRVQPTSSTPSSLSSSNKIKPPAKPPSDQSPDDSYFSAERQQFTESTASSESTPEVTENPEGPWECEHCTFINPKSTKVCTICCKTPSEGYKVMKGNRRGISKVKLNKRGEISAMSQQLPPSSKRRDSNRDSSSTSNRETGAEEVPVLKSKLSISREKQQAKINLVSKVENERVRAPGKSALKAGSSGTLKAGSVPPGHKVAVAAAASSGTKKVGKARQQKTIVPDESDDEEEEEEEEEEEDEDQDIEDAAQVESDEEDEQEIENDEENGEDEHGDNDADDEDGVVDVKITSASSKLAGRAGSVSSSKGMIGSGRKVPVPSGGRAPKKFTKGRRVTNAATKKLVDSNEDVYGSVPIQTLAISPKIEIRRSSKAKVSTGVGSSPPDSYELSIVQTSFDSATATTPSPKLISDEVEAEPAISAQDTSKRVKKGSVKDSNEKIYESFRASPEVSTIVVSSSSGSSGSTKQKRASVTTGMQTGNPANSKRNSVGTGESETGSSSPFRARKDSEDVTASIDVSTNQDKKSSVGVGTSPPPQNISTQTYEDAGAAGADTASITSPPTKSSSKTSLRSDEYEPPRQIEMSEKAMRYARKARSKEQQYQKLKRSMSTHLTYTAEPWMDPPEGRHLYRSSSRQSLASDTRSLPLSGPPSRESSPPPLGRYGANSSRGGWYEDFRRYPSSTMWESKYGMPPPPGDFFASIDDLMSRRRRESMRSQDFELTRMLRDAEESNFTPEDVQVAVRMCGDKNPIKWLQENWSSIIETVQTLATKYGREKGLENNDVGTISKEEARDSIRANRGNVWAAVTECVDQRRKKFHELQSRGTFLREDILTALTANHGNLEASYVELSKAQLKPFLMRIWGPPTDPDNESVAPSSSDEGKSMKAAEEREPLPSGFTERSNSLPGRGKAITSSGKHERKTSLGKLSSSDVNVEQRPLDEMHASSAEKVMEQIGKAIEELNISEAYTSSVSDEKDATDPIEKLAENPASAKESQKSESESDPSCAVAQHVKSDGEDESFVDAVSGTASIASSPPPLPPPLQLDTESANNRENESEINNNVIAEIINLVENADPVGAIGEEDDFEEEDVLEIEIDDTEANISEFIQNYEIVPVIANAASPSEEMNVAQEAGQSHESEGPAPNQEIEEESNGNDPQNNANGGITKVEIEQLLTTLTSTFSSMEEFAHKIKENIASEIQQQLAAAKAKTSHDHSEDGSYEPIALPPGIEEHVNKKVAKYQRLAAKKKQKVARHKSPETREFQFGTGKEPSVSPLPASSKGKGDREQDKEDSTELSRGSTEPDQDEDESERVETAASHFSDYEEVEIGQEEVEQEEDEEEEEDDDANDDGAEGEFGVEEEEDINESSIVEESEEELLIGAEDEAPEEDEGGEDSNIYANVELTSGASITPNDTDKVIIAGNGGLSAAVKAIRNSSANNTNNAVVIVAENLTPVVESQEKKTEEEVKEIEVEDTPSKRLIQSGKVDTPAQAELALQLLDMNFSEDDSLSAAKECASLDSALSFLQQECDLCTGKFSAREMVSMLRCTHLCCRNCARDYFTVQVRDKTIVDATCPFCAEPSTLTDDAELATEYFNHLDILLKNLLAVKHHEMFQRKLRDWSLNKTPNFKWCSKCSSGFITEPLQTRLVCPDCKAVTCAVCMETWDKVNHDHRDDVTGASKKLCDTVPKSIIEYLNANHTECPRCHFRFSLARGGCMHLTCTQCHHEFCSGCAAPFRMGEKCEAKYPICDKLGLHAHHPRNCLFYLRDKEPEVLSKLLEENAIPYFKENSGEDPSENTKPQRICQVPIQKETSDGFMDDVCGKEAPEGFATVCRTHYIEYLGLLIWQNHLDPITILTNDDLEVIVRRAYKKHPGRPNWLSDEGFRKRLLKVINEEIPL